MITKRVQTKSKFHPDTILAKLHMRRLRLLEGYNLEDAAMVLGISRKQLEDIETHRSYGSYIDWLLILDYCEAYNVMPGVFTRPMTQEQIRFLKPKKRLDEDQTEQSQGINNANTDQTNRGTANNWG